METLEIGKRCKLTRAIRDTQGKMRHNEEPIIIRVTKNLGREMYLVEFNDGSTSFLMPDEITIPAEPPLEALVAGLEQQNATDAARAR